MTFRLAFVPLRAFVLFFSFLQFVAIESSLADTVVLKSGKKLVDVVVSVNDDERVVVNPWNSRCPDMKWEIGKEWIFAKDLVKEVVIADPPRVQYLRRAAKRPLDAAAHLEIAKFCEEQGFKDERLHHLEACLALEPTNQDALTAYTETRWKSTQLKNPALAPAVVEAAREYVAAADAAAASEAWSKLVRVGEKRPRFWLERARRSAKIQKGRRDRVKLTIESEKTPGATYCILVPKTYDPLVPTPLVVALHGGGQGGVDATIVEGSGEDAMPFYQDLAERWGWIVVAPTAVVAPWQDKQTKNAQLVESLLAEMKMLFHVDLTRVYVTGHSMGGFGSWYFGSKHDTWWTACAPCAGGGGPRELATNDLPVYIYHGADDAIVGVGSDRNAATQLRGDDKKKNAKDFVYTELDGVGHGFPDWVRRDIFEWFAGRASVTADKKKKFVGPISSFDAKPTKLEIDAFGDPQKPDDDDTADSTKSLLADLEKGGGAGEQALARLAAIGQKDPKSEKTARLIVPLLDPKKRSVDTRVLAVRAIGSIAKGEPYAIKLIAPAIDDPDYRVVDAVIDALAVFGIANAKEAAPQLAKCSARLAELFAASWYEGKYVAHTEYEVRTASYGKLLVAVAGVSDGATFLPLIERDLVKPVFLPKPLYVIEGDSDPRFKDVSRNCRLALVKQLAACLKSLADPRGAGILRSIADQWATETKLVNECEQGIAELSP